MLKPIRDDEKCFQYAVIVALIHKKMGKPHKDSQTLSLSLIDITGKEQITHQEKIARKVLKKNNPKIYLNVSYVKKNICKKYLHY